MERTILNNKNGPEYSGPFLFISRKERKDKFFLLLFM